LPFLYPAFHRTFPWVRGVWAQSKEDPWNAYFPCLAVVFARSCLLLPPALCVFPAKNEQTETSGNYRVINPDSYSVRYISFSFGSVPKSAQPQPLCFICVII